jgi:hypothetical protein
MLEKGYNMPSWTAFVAPTVYALMILYLVFENQRGSKNDKYPCVIAKARKNPEPNNPDDKWSIRLINVGRGPAFIKKFTTYGLTTYPEGDNTHLIDKVLGPGPGDANLQIEFTFEVDLEILRSPDVTIEIEYEDIAGRSFISGIERGNPFWKPPVDFKESWLRTKINQLKRRCGCRINSE